MVSYKALKTMLVMMYHLLYGKLPWFFDVSRQKEQDAIDRILLERDKELDLPNDNRYELDNQLLNTIAKALCYDIEERFQTAEEFIKAIEGEEKIEKKSTRRKILSHNYTSGKEMPKPC